MLPAWLTIVMVRGLGLGVGVGVGIGVGVGVDPGVGVGAGLGVPPTLGVGEEEGATGMGVIPVRGAGVGVGVDVPTGEGMGVLSLQFPISAAAAILRTSPPTTGKLLRLAINPPALREGRRTPHSSNWGPPWANQNRVSKGRPCRSGILGRARESHPAELRVIAPSYRDSSRKATSSGMTCSGASSMSQCPEPLMTT